MDIALPKDNEKELSEMAKRLGEEKIIFLYPPENLAQANFSYPSAPKGILSNNANEIRKARSKGIFAASQKSDIDIIEAGVNIIIEPEILSPKDSLHSRNSGLNQVILSLMAKKEVSYGISLGMILENEGKERVTIIGRIMQNISLAKKYGVKTEVVSFTSHPFGLRSPKARALLLKIDNLP